MNARRIVAAIALTGLLATVSVVVLVAVSLRGDAASPPGPSIREFAARSETVEPSTVEMARGLTQSGVQWTVSTYSSSEGLCIDVHGQSTTNREEAGGMESCGPGDEFTWSSGGVALGDDWHRIAVGVTPPGGHVELELRDGSLLSDPNEDSGIWMIVVSGDKAETSLDAAKITAFDAEGVVLEAVTPVAPTDLEAAFRDAKSPSPSST